MVSDARIREIMREEIAAHEACKRVVGRQKWLKNLADLQDKFAEQNTRFTAETGIEVQNPITDRQLTDLAAALREQRKQRAASVGLLFQGQNAPLQHPDISPQSRQDPVVDVVDVREFEFQGSESADESGEYSACVVGVIGRGIAVSEDLGDVGHQLFGDGSGIATAPTSEVEGISQRHDASPSVGADTPNVGGEERPRGRN
jgi:hypothetical protein